MRNTEESLPECQTQRSVSSEEVQVSGKKVEEEPEEAEEVFGSAAGAPEVSLQRFGMGEEGEIGSKKRKQRVDVGSKLCGERSKLQGGLHLVASLALHFSKELVPPVSWRMVA